MIHVIFTHSRERLPTGKAVIHPATVTAHFLPYRAIHVLVGREVRVAAAADRTVARGDRDNVVLEHLPAFGAEDLAAFDAAADHYAIDPQDIFAGLGSLAAASRTTISEDGVREVLEGSMSIHQCSKLAEAFGIQLA